MKTCPCCKLTKEPKDFYPSTSRKDGLSPYCRTCSAEKRKASAQWQKAYNQHYYQTNKEEIAIWSNAYHRDNKEKRNQYSRKYSSDRVTNHPAVNILVRTKSRAKRLGLPFDLTLDDIVVPDVCPVLGIPLVCGSGGRGGRMDSPSIDRIDPALGYVRGNVRIISNRANTLKNNASLAELEMVLTDLRNLKGTD